MMAAGVFKLSECCALNFEHIALLLWEATSPTSPLNGSDIRIMSRADVPSFILYLCWLRAKCCFSICSVSKLDFDDKGKKQMLIFSNLILKNIPGEFFPGLLFHNPSGWQADVWRLADCCDIKNLAYFTKFLLLKRLPVFLQNNVSLCGFAREVSHCEYHQGPLLILKWCSAAGSGGWDWPSKSSVTVNGNATLPPPSDLHKTTTKQCVHASP